MSEGPELPARIIELYDRMTDDSRPATDRLVDAQEFLTRLRIFERELVADARSAGYTWDEIAAALGITRQTAAARYG